MNYRAGLFDLDGVLVDTAKYHYLAWKRLAEEYGFAFTEQDNERLKGVSRMASLEILLSVGGITLTEVEKRAAADKKNRWYVEYIHGLRMDEVLPGAREYLEYLREQGVRTALCSASANAPLILERLGLGSLLDVVVDARKITRAKPDPEVFTVACQTLDFLPEECIVFEDAPAGVEAALAGGMYCVGIGNPQILSRAHLVIPGLYAAQEAVKEEVFP